MLQLGLYSGGSLSRYEAFAAKHIQARHVDVWCPPGYDSGAARYPVLYMHDGQNLFEPAWSYLGIDWGIDEAIGRLMAEGAIDGAIVVGIWHSPQRRLDYMPQVPLMTGQARAPLEQFVREQGSLPESDAYLRFMVEELKPFVDAAYRTLPDRAHTVVMGSSMGGLISLYALTEHPAISAGQAAYPLTGPAGARCWWTISAECCAPGDHRIYFDYGTETQDAAYEAYQLQMDTFMQAAGYQRGKDWITRKFVGAEHSERAWRARVDVPLRFLLASS
jgi:hypothetical protein